MTTTGDTQYMTDATHIDAYLRHLRAAGHPDTTINTWRSPLRRAAAELPHGLAATTDEVEAWLAGLRGTVSHNTLASYTVALRNFYGWCIRTGRLDPNGKLDPAHLPRIGTRRGQPDPVPLDELTVLLTQARQPYRMWATIAAYGGLRCCELAGLDRGDVTEETVHVRRGKGGTQRRVPTHPVVWQAVADLPPGPVCGGATAKRVSDNINRECDRLGIGDVHAHRLRHTAATLWHAAAGGDLLVTQRLLGHASVSTTQIYAGVADATLRAAVLAVPAITPPTAAGPR